MAEPLVSVCVITYQHNNFIKQCLDGILEQKTDFPFEILIGDDGSVDGTREICEAYAEQYPQIIRLFCWDRNADRSSFPGGPGRYNTIHTLQQAKTAYIALCEGDDYWTNANKLQRQISFLQSNPEFSISYHAVHVNNNGELSLDNLTRGTQDEFSIYDLANGNFIHTPSVVYRNIFPLEFPDFFKTAPVLDYLLHLYVAQKGKIKYFSEPMAVYRIHGESYWSSKTSQVRSILWLQVLTPLISYFTYDEEVSSLLKQQAYKLGSYFLTNPKNLQQEDLKNVLSNLISIDPVHFLKLFQKNSNVISLEKLLDLLQNNLKKTDLSVYKVVSSIVNKNVTWLISNQLKDLFVLKAVKLVFSELNNNTSSNLLLTYQQEKNIRDCLQLLTSYSLDNVTEEAVQLKQLLRQWWEYKRYQAWINNHALMEIDAQIHAERMMGWSSKPTFHLFMFMFEGEQNLLADTLDSLSQQLYKKWKLTIISDFASPDVMFEELDVLEWLMLPKHEEPYEFLNTTIKCSPADWISFIPAGTCFEPQMWLQIGDYINLHKQKAAFYSDDDFISGKGERYQPRFKPDFNLDLLRSQDYIGIILCKRTLFEAINGFDKVPGHENMSLAFKVYEQVGADGIGHVADILLHLPETVLSLYSTQMSMQAVQQHLDRQKIPAIAEQGVINNTVKVTYKWITTPKVTIIIPTKDKLEYLRPCVEATLTKNNYPNFEIIIVNNRSEDPDTIEYLQQLSELPELNIRVVDYPHSFNFAAISNLARDKANGEYLLFLNNDTEALHPEWLERMMSHAQRPEVGVVGAKLVYPESGLIQHAGLILGMNDIADHLYVDLLDLKDPGYMGRAQVDQNFSAVTGACLLIRKAVYDQVGGMDAENFAVSYNDIDLCLKVRRAGFLVAWTPYSVLVHHEKITLKSESKQAAEHASKIERFQNERQNMLNRWLPEIANDPAFNRNLSLAHRECLIESVIPSNWDTNFSDRIKILGLPLNGGSGEYRIIQPFNGLSHAGMAQCEHYRFRKDHDRSMMISEFSRIAPDSVVFHAAMNDTQLKQLEQLKEYLPDVFRIYTIDDLLTNVPEKSSAYKSVKRHFSDAKPRLRRALSASDRLIVSTQPLADLCADMIHDIQVIPNRLPKDPWVSLSSLKNQGIKPRVGWAGAQQHQGDLAIMNEVIKATTDEVEWIFMGMCLEEVKPYVHEFHDAVPIDEYPAKLASLNLDLAIAPLEIHPFNIAKSNLRLLEYGVLGWPVICTDIYPYQTNNPPVMRVSNDVDIWVAAIRQILADKAALADAGTALRAWVIEHYMLEDHLDEWLNALTKN